MPDVGRVQSGSGPAGEDKALIAPLLSCRASFLLLPLLVPLPSQM
jgi:hypothetical protein